ncbi:MAG: histidine kinase dimerization/phospho-acceptor domain-containing protein [Thermodesulfobacteriota bacterium]
MNSRSPFIRMLLAALALLTGIAIFIFYQASYKADAELLREFEEREAKNLSLVEWLLASKAPYSGTSSLRALTSELAKRMGVRITYVVDGKVLAESGLSPEETDRMDDHSNRPEIAQARKTGFGKFTRHSSTLQVRLLYMAKPVSGVEGLPDGVLRIAVPYTSVRNILDESRSQFMAVVSAMALCAAILAGFLVFRTRGMLLSFSRTVDEIGRGETPDKIRVCPGSEFKPLMDSINVLAKRARKSIRRLKEAQSQLEAVLANMTDAVAVLDQDGAILMHNAALESLIGSKAGSCAGASVLDAGLGADVFRAVRQALDSREQSPRRFQARLASGAVADVDLLPYLTAKGRQRLILVLHDVTSMADSQRILREFVIDASHRLRTPLTSIQGFASTLVENPPEDQGQAASMLTTILKKSQEMSAVVTSLLDKASPQAGAHPESKQQ